jgi:hypothetical protein
MKQICGNCPLYNKKEKTCEVSVVHRGVVLELMCEAADECYWIKNDIAISQIKVDYDGNKRIIAD